MTMSRQEAMQMLIAMYPPGYDQVLDLTPGTNAHGMMYATSGAMKAYLSDYIDTLRDEVNPSTCTQKIPDWERSLGLSETPIAKFGTTAQRRNAIIAWLRQSGTFCVSDIQALCQPYLLYSNPTQIQIIETNRPILTIAHSYYDTAGLPYTVTAGTTKVFEVEVKDDPTVSRGGAKLALTWTGDISATTTVALYSPTGLVGAWGYSTFGTGARVAQDVFFWSRDAIGKPIRGTWKVVVTAGANDVEIDAWLIFTEAVGVNYQGSWGTGWTRNGEGLGAKMFEWIVMADSSKLGTGYDLAGCFRALRRAKPAHTQVYLGVSDGGTAMIYDETTSIYDMGIYG